MSEIVWRDEARYEQALDTSGLGQYTRFCRFPVEGAGNFTRELVSGQPFTYSTNGGILWNHNGIQGDTTTSHTVNADNFPFKGLNFDTDSFVYVFTGHAGASGLGNEFFELRSSDGSCYFSAGTAYTAGQNETAIRLNHGWKSTNYLVLPKNLDTFVVNWNLSEKMLKVYTKEGLVTSFHLSNTPGTNGVTSTEVRSRIFRPSYNAWLGMDALLARTESFTEEECLDLCRNPYQIMRTENTKNQKTKLHWGSIAQGVDIYGIDTSAKYTVKLTLAEDIPDHTGANANSNKYLFDARRKSDGSSDSAGGTGYFLNHNTYTLASSGFTRVAVNGTDIADLNQPTHSYTEIWEAKKGDVIEFDTEQGRDGTVIVGNRYSTNSGPIDLALSRIEVIDSTSTKIFDFTTDNGTQVYKDMYGSSAEARLVNFPEVSGYVIDKGYKFDRSTYAIFPEWTTSGDFTIKGSVLNPGSNITQNIIYGNGSNHLEISESNVMRLRISGGISKEICTIAEDKWIDFEVKYNSSTGMVDFSTSDGQSGSTNYYQSGLSFRAHSFDNLLSRTSFLTLGDIEFYEGDTLVRKYVTNSQDLYRFPETISGSDAELRQVGTIGVVQEKSKVSHTVGVSGDYSNLANWWTAQSQHKSSFNKKEIREAVVLDNQTTGISIGYHFGGNYIIRGNTSVFGDAPVTFTNSKLSVIAALEAGSSLLIKDIKMLNDGDKNLDFRYGSVENMISIIKNRATYGDDIKAGSGLIKNYYHVFAPAIDESYKIYGSFNCESMLNSAIIATSAVSNSGWNGTTSMSNCVISHVRGTFSGEHYNCIGHSALTDSITNHTVDRATIQSWLVDTSDPDPFNWDVRINETGQEFLKGKGENGKDILDYFYKVTDSAPAAIQGAINSALSTLVTTNGTKFTVGNVTATTSTVVNSAGTKITSGTTNTGVVFTIITTADSSVFYYSGSITTSAALAISTAGIKEGQGAALCDTNVSVVSVASKSLVDSLAVVASSDTLFEGAKSAESLIATSQSTPDTSTSGEKSASDSVLSSVTLRDVLIGNKATSALANMDLTVEVVERGHKATFLNLNTTLDTLTKVLGHNGALDVIRVITAIDAKPNPSLSRMSISRENITVTIRA